MDKKTIKTITAVILAICLFTMITATVSLIFDAILSKDVLIYNNGSAMEKAVSYMKNASIALACLLIPTLACYVFSYFTEKKKLFFTASAASSLFLAAVCFGFLFDLRKTALKEFGSSTYAACAEFFSNLISLAVVSLIVCAWFTVNAVILFKQSKERSISDEEASHEEA